GIAVAVIGVGNRIGAIAQYIDVRNSSARRKNRGPGCQVVNLFCRWGIGGGKERAQIRGELFHARFRTIESSALFVVHSGESLPFRDQEHEAHHHGGHQQEQKECGDERNEERRVGKEGRDGWEGYCEEKKGERGCDAVVLVRQSEEGLAG